jgi:UPF0755 protein
MGLESKLKAGDYELDPARGTVAILSDISSGKVLRVNVTIPEGSTARQVARIVASRGLASEDEVMALVVHPTPELLAIVGAASGDGSLEGYLFPDTYQFARGVGAHEVVRAMLRRFAEVIQPRLAQGRALGLSDREVLILASIVEREAKVGQERPKISRVFLNRIRLGMPLQSCATVQYALPQSKDKLLLEDLTVDSPYNTYIHPGLPPGPICSPGLESVVAVLEPSSEDYLYFVARNDGSHLFSRTYAEHLRAKARAESGR